jgi:hypothetical protein
MILRSIFESKHQKYEEAAAKAVPRSTFKTLYKDG